LLNLGRLEEKLSTTPKALQARFGVMPRRRLGRLFLAAGMALENGMHSPGVSRLLSGLGHETLILWRGKPGYELIPLLLHSHLDLRTHDLRLFGQEKHPAHERLIHLSAPPSLLHHSSDRVAVRP
jgi:hypothetical protein